LENNLGRNKWVGLFEPRFYDLCDFRDVKLNFMQDKDLELNIEGKFIGGVMPQEDDARDFAFTAVAPFDWKMGFDIRKVLAVREICKDQEEFFGTRGRNGWGVERYKEIIKIFNDKKLRPYKIPVKNQGSSGSCTGQALAYYLEVLNFIETGEWVKISARDVYAYTSIGFGKGGYLRDALKLAVERGIGSEDLVPCYDTFKLSDGSLVVNAMTETEYLVKPIESPELIAVRKSLQGKEYRSIAGSGKELMDVMAWAMLLGLGNYFAVNGENNGTWQSEYPKPPVGSGKWGHALFAGVAELDSDEKPYIGDLNSWGNDTGVDGWQKLKEDYFITNNIQSPWTYIDKDNNYNNMAKANVKIIKDKNSPAVGIWLPALSPQALESLCLNFGIETPKLPDGSIDWKSWVDGELTITKAS